MYLVRWFMTSLFFVIQCVAFNSHAASLAQEKISEIPQVLKLEKITVGPYDNFQGDLDQQERQLVFTRMINRVPLLFTQDMATFNVQPILDFGADARDPSLSPSGNQVAFVFYQRLARGQVCWRFIEKKGDLSCVPPGESEMATPFWLSESRLGFVQRSPDGIHSTIHVYDLQTQQDQLLYKGAIWSPSPSRDGKWLVFVKGDGAAGTGLKKVLALMDLSTQKVYELKVEMPGVAGFPTFSSNGDHIYFTQFLNDTNDDSIVDSNDHGVVFRLSAEDLQRAKKGEAVFPEQLTSAETNCSFPQPKPTKLYVTCGFEGSLDIYSLPLTGLVPASWTASSIWNAHRSSRTYWQRILMLNSLRYRERQVGSADLLARLLSDHWLGQDSEAAAYFIHKLSQASPAEAQLLSIIGDYIRSHQLVRSSGGENLSPSAQKELNRFLIKYGNMKSKAGKMDEITVAHQLLQMWLRTQLRGRKSEIQSLARVSTVIGQAASPFLLGMYYSVSQSLLAKNGESKQWDRVFAKLVNAESLSEESRLFYAYSYLRLLQDTNVSRLGRIERIKEMKKRTNDDLVSSLFESEIVVLTMVGYEDEKERRKIYGNLDKLMVQSQNHYYLRRALYVRAIENFVAFDMFDYLNYVAGNWLKYTQRDDTEFYYARDHFIEAVTSRGYFHLARKQYVLAAGLFYNGLALADDLESHFSYILTLSEQHKSNELQRTYDNLKRLAVVSETYPYIQAVQLVLEKARDGKERETRVKKAIDLLTSMRGRETDPMWHLLLGYCYLEQVLADREAASEMVEKTHYHLMLAVDLSRERKRLQASALINLALLHQHAGNHGLANRFFEQRDRLPYLNREQEIIITLLHARSLFYTSDYKQAARLIETLLNQQGIGPQWQPILYERLGLYLGLAGDFKRSTEIYGEWLRKNPATTKLLRAKAHLGMGRGYLHLHKAAQAESAFQEALRLAMAEEARERGQVSIRVVALVHGYLAQLTKPQQARVHLQARGEILSMMGKDLNGWKLRESDWLLAEALNSSQLAAAEQSMGESGMAKNSLERSANIMFKLIEASNNYLDYGIYRTMINRLVHVTINPQLYNVETVKSMDGIIEKMVKAYRGVPGPTDVLRFRELKLRLHRAIALKRLGTAGNESEEEVLQDPYLTPLATKMKGEWTKFMQWSAKY